MNLNITNYGSFRVTDHGGRRYDLFNSTTGVVYGIERWEYDLIKKDGVEGCEMVYDHYTQALA